ncbi:MAG TPA: SDR family oxidoreductase [Candidatus Dormibacteraeota bacterium]|jgi:NAD(P)-dependent dehydrogenase (short-subunit alcohol dehydrogenase family)|nr:SDR family oxidoreductase [Candidatus Dormibacteraeota bacterium]
MKVALITGAAQGIGQRTSEVFAERGFALALNDLRSPSETLARTRQQGVRAIEVLGSVADEAAVERMADTVMQEFGRIDVLVNNAGIASIAPAEETTTEEWRRVMEVNLLGPFLCCRKFGRIMLKQRSGSIVNVASVAGLLGVADRAAYNASKHGLIGLTRTLAAEWGGRGVRCNAVCPGWVKTPMDDASQGAGFYRDNDIINRVPQARFATPDDIAQAVSFLADPAQSGFVNGHALSVDGGWASDGSWESLRIKHR